jgi:uncharacterized delta-60 repeat protein
VKVGLIVIVAVFVALVSNARATDFGVDTTFDAGSFGGVMSSCGAPIRSVYKQPDGKLVVGGAFTTHNDQPVVHLLRLNTDGSRDMTFQSPIQSGYHLGQSCVKRIRPLLDGTLMVIGEFKIAGENTNYVKLTANGALDPSMPNRDDTGRDIVQTPDGKFIVCGARDINSEVYWIAHRLNGDGSVDPTFRITYAQGNCDTIALIGNDRLLMEGSFLNGSGPFHRFNIDGSRDATFQVQYVGTSPGSSDFALYPDGKVLVTYISSAGRLVQRLSSDGQVELTFPNCYGNAILPEADGTAIISDCRKFANGPNYEFADIWTDGKIVPDMDWFHFSSGGRTVEGFVDAGGGKYYAYGSFTSVDGISRQSIVRLMPRASYPVKAKFDFDGDGKSDHAVWRPSDRVWYVNQSTAGPLYFQWGLSTDIPVASDYDSDGRPDIAIFREGLWYLNMPSGLEIRFFGQAGDRPLVGELTGLGDETQMLRRTQGGTVTWLRQSGTQQGSSMGAVDGGELASDIPVVGDFDGDRREEIGYFRNGAWVTRDSQGMSTLTSFQWGAAGDIPVPEDYDGDGKDDYAIFRPSTGVWWINRSTEGWLIVKWGISSDIPVPADYDGDGKVDLAIYRDGQWWQYLSATQSILVTNWGIAGDIPIPAQHR